MILKLVLFIFGKILDYQINIDGFEEHPRKLIEKEN
jgi:hypothetical protein